MGGIGECNVGKSGERWDLVVIYLGGASAWTAVMPLKGAVSEASSHMITPKEYTSTGKE